MIITNADKAEISYRHQNKIQAVFNAHIRGFLGITHLSINIFYRDGKGIFISPNPDMASELCRYNFVDYDSNYSPEIYKNTPVYPWRSVQRNDMDRAINLIKEEKYDMRSGIMIVRYLGYDRYAMYSVATDQRDNIDFPGQYLSLYCSKADLIAQAGDLMYDSLLDIINEYTEQDGVTMPPIGNYNFAPLAIEREPRPLQAVPSAYNVDFVRGMI